MRWPLAEQGLLQGRWFDRARHLAQHRLYSRDRLLKVIGFLVIALLSESITRLAQGEQVFLQFQGRGVERVHAFLMRWASVPL